MRPFARGAALVAAALATGPLAAQQARIYEVPEDLPEGPGREAAFYQCSACHGFNLVARQGLTRALWEDTWNLMVERHGMVDPGPADREAILAYLEAAFPPRSAPAGWQNPFTGN